MNDAPDLAQILAQILATYWCDPEAIPDIQIFCNAIDS